MTASPNSEHPSRRPISRATFLRLGGAMAAGLVVPASLRNVASAADRPAATVGVDLRRSNGRPTYRATGFLNGLSQNGTRPEDELLRPLKPQLFRGGGSVLPGRGWGGGNIEGYRPRWQYVLDTYTRVSAGPYRSEYCIVIPDLWGAEGVTLGAADRFPGDDGDWEPWETFLTQLLHDVKAAGMKPDLVQYEIWNEPDYSEVYFPRPKAQYQELWRRGVRTIRRLDQHARIVGPTFTRITTSGPSWHMDEWLDMTVATDTAPDILSWHDLIPGRDPVVQADLARHLLTARGLAHVQLELNEYPSNVGLDPGYNSWYIARLERAEIDYGVLAIFGSCCMFPQLDGLLTQQGDALIRAGRWWLYERYASIAGTLVAVTPTAVFDGVAGLDRRHRQARILLGNSRGDGAELGTVRVNVDGMDAARHFLTEDGKVRVRVERIPDRLELGAPEVLRDIEVDVGAEPDRDRLTVDVPWTDADSAYVITLGNQDTELPPYVIIDTDPREPVLIRNRATEVAVRLRNYTDAPLTVPIGVEAPTGYSVQAPSTVTLPANADAFCVLTLTRTTADLTGGTLRVTIGDQPIELTLVATDDFVRLATMTASSTFPPSSPTYLNDGDTDPEHWGGGGAGGWNDNTQGEFPDTVTARWDSPVTFRSIRVHTLDSAAYPAKYWGVRDYDLVVDAGGTDTTVATVRGNTAGVIESTFAAVTTTRLDVVVRGSNSGDYSRLIEIEAVG